MLIRKSVFYPGRQLSPAFRGCGELQANRGEMKRAYLTREEESINFPDIKCWQHRTQQVLFGYKRRRWDEEPVDHLQLLSIVVLENFVLSGRFPVAPLSMWVVDFTLYFCIRPTCRRSDKHIPKQAEKIFLISVSNVFMDVNIYVYVYI